MCDVFEERHSQSPLQASIVLSFGHTRTVNALDTCNPTIPKTCTIKDLAKRLGIRFGATLEDF